MHALISVSDKTGVLELARGLHALGIRLLPEIFYLLIIQVV